MYKQSLTKEQALQKLKHYCAYQERCHSEVREKMYLLGVWKKDHDELIAALIEENYLNEERFALAFAGGKFRIKKWGRVKIRYLLKQKQVSEYCIRKALQQIGDDEYAATARQEAWAKFSSLKNIHLPQRQKKTIDYLVHRGYEADIAKEAVQQFTEKNSAA